MGVELGLLTRLQHDPPDAHALILEHQIGADRIRGNLRLRQHEHSSSLLVILPSQHGVGALVARCHYPRRIRSERVLTARGARPTLTGFTRALGNTHAATGLT